jgi:hypothetical protein
LDDADCEQLSAAFAALPNKYEIFEACKNGAEKSGGKWKGHFGLEMQINLPEFAQKNKYFLYFSLMQTA